MRRVTRNRPARPRIRALLTQIKMAGGGWAYADEIGTLFIRSAPMMDVVMLAIGFAFFALSIAYVYACDLL